MVSQWTGTIRSANQLFLMALLDGFLSDKAALTKCWRFSTMLDASMAYTLRAPAWAEKMERIPFPAPTSAKGDSSQSFLQFVSPEAPRVTNL